MLTRHRARHARQQATAGPFRIVVTAVRPNATTVADTESRPWYRRMPARNEKRRPELVVLTVSLPVDFGQAYALSRAAGIVAAIPADSRPHYRVKVVAA